jgi:hypothetical protein
MIYFLHSVGTAFDPATLETWPIQADGSIAKDEDFGMPMSQLTDEWWAALGRSSKDMQLVGRVWRGPEHPRGSR